MLEEWLSHSGSPVAVVTGMALTSTPHKLETERLMPLGHLVTGVTERW